MRTILESDSDFICDIKAPCFKDLEAEEAEVIRSSRTQVLFRKGDSLTKQGAFASYVLFVMSGLAREYVEGDGNRNFNLRIVRPGEFLGLSAVFSENVFTYSCVALTDCQVYLVEKDAIANLARKNGRFGSGIIRRYCSYNNNYLNIIGSLVYRQMNGRLAGVLLYLDGLKQENPHIFQLLSRKDIADFAAISMESAVKLLKTFEKDGLISLYEKDIVITNSEMLAEISRRG